jgi:hypothetical protein
VLYVCENVSSGRTPDFEFNDEVEIWWSYVRQRVSEILQFDPRWLTDTERSAEVLAQGGQTVAHISKRTLPSLGANVVVGPGLTWWGCPLPVHADIVRSADTGYGMLRAGVLLGNLGDTIDPDLYRWLNNTGKKTPASALLISPENDLWLCHASAIDRTMLEEASVRLAGLMHRLSAHGVVLAAELFGSGELQPIDQQHPCSAGNVDTDYYLSVLFENGVEPVVGPEGSQLSPEGVPLSPFYTTGVAENLAQLYELPIHTVSDNQLGTVLWGGDSLPGIEYAFRCYPTVPANFKFEALRNDPRVWIYVKHFLRNPETYPDQLSAFLAANNRLWMGWVSGSSTILGAPEVTLVEIQDPTDSTLYVLTAVASVWPAAAMAPVGMDPAKLADLLYRLFAQTNSQFNWLHGY